MLCGVRWLRINAPKLAVEILLSKVLQHQNNNTEAQMLYVLLWTVSLFSSLTTVNWIFRTLCKTPGWQGHISLKCKKTFFKWAFTFLWNMNPSVTVAVPEFLWKCPLCNCPEVVLIPTCLSGHRAKYFCNYKTLILLSPPDPNAYLITQVINSI